jgi:MFS family permease
VVGRAVGVLCLVQFVDVLGVTVVVSALPSMLRDLSASSDAGSLIVTSYATFFGALLLVGSTVGDRFGHRRTIAGGLVAFAGAAVVGATAGSIAVLAVARCLQGAAAALCVPSALRLLTTVTGEGRARQAALAAWSAAGAAAGASGLVAGGVVTQFAGWRAIFWGYLVLAGVLGLVVIALVPAADGGTPALPERWPVAGLVTAVSALMTLVVATTLAGRSDTRTVGIGLCLVAVVLGGAFVWTQRRSATPLVPRAALRRRYLRAGTWGSLANTFVTSSAITLVTLYVQDSLGRSASAAGLTILPFSLAVVVTSSLTPKVVPRWGLRPVLGVGLALVAAGDAALVLAVPSLAGVAACVAVSGAGLGLASVAATTLGTSVPKPERAVASGVINTAAQIGTAVGTAAVLLLATVTTGAFSRGSAAPAPAWLSVAAVAAVGAVLSFRLVDRSPVPLAVVKEAAEPRSNVD